MSINSKIIFKKDSKYYVFNNNKSNSILTYPTEDYLFTRQPSTFGINLFCTQVSSSDIPESEDNDFDFIEFDPDDIEI
jgi:hypothetical protein